MTIQGCSRSSVKNSFHMLWICFECKVRANMAVCPLTEVKPRGIWVTGSKKTLCQCGNSYIPHFHWLQMSFRDSNSSYSTCAEVTKHKNAEWGNAEILKWFVHMLLSAQHYHTCWTVWVVTIRWVYIHYGLAGQCSAWLDFPAQTLVWL